MSDPKKPPMPGKLLPNTPGSSVRDAMLTPDEGDALLDMLFDDAVRPSQEPALAEAAQPAPIADPPTPVPSAEPMPSAGSRTATPFPGTAQAVTPPGWATGGPNASPRAPDVAEDADDEPSTALFRGDDADDGSTRAFRDPAELQALLQVSEESALEEAQKQTKPPPAGEAGFDDDDGGSTIIASTVAPRPPVGPPPAAAPRPAAPRAAAPAAPPVAQAAPDEHAEDDGSGGQDQSFDDVAAMGEQAPDEADYDDAPAAAPHRPISIAPRAALPSQGFESEQDASSVIAQNPELRDAMVDRVARLRAEADLRTDKAQKARLLVLASEIYAILGEDEAAAGAAQEAYQAAPNLPTAIRHYRSMITRSGDWARASEIMEAEVRHMPTPEGRVHVAWLSSEVARIGANDDADVQKRSEQALRAAPADPRASVQRFVRALVQGTDPAQLAKLRSSSPESLGAVDAAFAQVAALRAQGEAPARRAGPARHVAEVVAGARVALEKGDRAALAGALSQLRQSSFSAAAGWLSGAILASRDDTRSQAPSAYRVAADGTAGNLARRALAGVALELGEGVDPRDREAFAPADRVALATLDAARTGPMGTAALDSLAPVLDEAAAESGTSEDAADVALLAGAAVAAVLPVGEQRLARLRYAGSGSSSARAAALMGRVLGAARSNDAATSESITSGLSDLVQFVEPGSVSRMALVRALTLELDIGSGATERVAQAISTWGSASGEADTTAMLASALLGEVAGDHEQAQRTYAAIHAEEPVHEVTARASAADPAALARSLKEHAATLPPGVAKAVLLTECAIRFNNLTLNSEGDENAALAQETDISAKAAAELAPELPLAAHIGEFSARTRGDQDTLVEWLRFRRGSSDDPIERAQDLAREALLVSDGESPTSGLLLEEAQRARPGDFGLRDLYERLATEPPADKATWREARALELDGAAEPGTPEAAEVARLAIEATHEFERTGDLESAARCAKLAASKGDDGLASIAAYRVALAGFGTADLVGALLPQARETEDAALRLEIYERLAELDERGRGDAVSATLFRRTILEENPAHLRTLRTVMSSLMSAGREDEMEPVAMELARNLDGAEAVAYAAVAVRLRLRTSWEETAEPVAIAYAQEPKALWAVRQMAAHARAQKQHGLAASCDQFLVELTDRPAERATLRLRAAESLGAAGDLAACRASLEEAITEAPEHVLARLALADLVDDAGDAALAAQHLEAAAAVVTTPEWKAQLLYRAAVLLQDRVGELDRARAALERVAEIDAGYEDVFERLRQLYIASGARGELADLLGRRLEGVEDPDQRVAIEVMRGQALAEIGDGEAAKRALAAALDANPDHIEALGAFATLCFADGDHGGAEEALIRLARLTSDPDKQVELYFRLGNLYDELLPNEDRAEAAYQEILKRRPDDPLAREKLIGLYRRSGQLQRAVEEQNLLVAAAEQPEDKCTRTIELAELLEELGELKKAETTLVIARKSYPKSDAALRALVKYYQRSGQAPAAAILLDRAVADARRALGTGRFEAFLFETLATTAEIRGRVDASAVARATVQALEAEETELEGVGLRAGDAKLDDLLAPEVMTPAFRDLLLRTGPLLDTAFPYDIDGVRAGPLPPAIGSLAEEVRAVAGAYGLPQIQVLQSAVLGPIVVPARSHPATLVIGATLAEQDPSNERTFLIHRAMKVIQSNTAVLARTAPIDLWPLLGAFLRLFSPQFSPQGVDAGRFNDAFGRLSRALPQGLPPELGTLAADVIGSIGNRASTLNAAVNGWGSRAGLLAVGDPNVALSGIAWASGTVSGPPQTGKERVTWVSRNAEARDLIIFAVSDHYVDARSRLGL